MAADAAPGGAEGVAARGLAAQGLALRAWALAVLGGGDVPPPAVTDAAWRVFLATEGCAVPLLERVRRQAPARVPRVLEAWARGELQRVLSARSQLRLLDRAAGRGGWPVVVLKGGVAVDSDPALDLVDLDLLLLPEQVLAFAAALEGDGYASAGVDYVEAGSEAHHLANRALPGSIPVELHFRLPVPEGAAGPWQRRIPLAGTRHLSRLEAADHLWHLLVHAAVQHPFKRGRLRDLLLIARALGESPEAVRASLRARAAAGPAAAALLGTWGMAQALAAGRTPADAFPRIAAGNYLLRAEPPRGAMRGHDVAVCVFALLGTADDRRALLRRVWHNPGHPSAIPSVARVERAAPWLGAAARRVARAVRYAAAAARSLPLAVRAHGAARGLRPAPGGVPSPAGE